MIRCYLKKIDELPDPIENPSVLEGIQTERAEKIRRLRFKDDRRRSLAAGLLLAEILPGYGIDPFKLHKGRNGKPEPERAKEIINGKPESAKHEKNPEGNTTPENSETNKPQPSYYFNLSHAGSYAVLAVSDQPVGCDLELLREEKGKVAKRFFSEGERSFIENAAPEEQTLAFFRVWTARESYMKHTGEGLTLAMDLYETVWNETGTVEAEQPAKAARMEKAEVGEQQDLSPSCTVIREGRKTDCLIRQSVLFDQYVLSVCSRDAAAVPTVSILSES
ncbi:MAG: 4'-phosphopantetheinyl transferase superfamily protein [Lachnospiraceae bacterium]|nr:4'-phosphopantetheinyl transferase superfamily protein [Lachnospiraceae bacterium]